MSVIAENESGWIVCCKTFFNSIYDRCTDENAVIHGFKFKDVFFEIRTPFLMNSQSQKHARLLWEKEIQFRAKVKKKHKRQTKTSTKASDEEKALLKFLSKETDLFVTIAKHLGHLEDSELTAKDWFENNNEARKAALEVLNYSNKLLSLGLHYESSSVISTIKQFGNDAYVLPPSSSFQLCDITDFFHLVDEKYDLIVIDPPWINKSVKRKHSYAQLKYNSLNDLAIEKITKPGCLIVVWITNSTSSSSFVMNELFPKCNIIASTMWHWCKITKKGNFVYPIESCHKKPYENLVLGRVAYECDSIIRPSKEIDSKKLIVSVPSSIHSHKPPLIEILKPFLMPDAQCLELFARYLLPGWKSVGNEVLKLQNVKLFDLLE